MNIGRIGHYFVPNNPEGAELAGSCQKADVVKVWSDTMVNLVVTDGDGDQQRRTSVEVAAPHEGSASFHLSGDCPWGR